MPPALRSRRLLALGLPLVAGFLVLAGVVGAGVSWLGLVRRQVVLADACERVEAASRQRLALLQNLLADLDAASGSPAALVDELVAAERAVSTTRLDPERIWDEELYRAHVEAQAQLGRAIERVRASLDGSGPSAAMWRGLDEQLSRQLARLDVGRAACRAAVSRFPGSLLAGIAGLEPAQAAARQGAVPPGSRGG
jgi:hypothetical protein